MNTTTNRQKLRTKTGCLTCRLRRKKCDEKSPVCKRCSTSGKNCQWPTADELLDRRYAAHIQFRQSPSADSSTTSSSEEAAVLELNCATPPSTGTFSKISHRSETASIRILASDLELALCRHFVEDYYGRLILPNCHSDIYYGLIEEIQCHMHQERGLRYSVLANAASHLHFIDECPKMQELALTYYSKALHGLSDTIAKSRKFSGYERNNGLLISIMLLYIHGIMGRGTYNDIPRHLNAATQVLKGRLLKNTLMVNQAFDRLAVESVLIEMFLASTGLWSDEHKLDYKFDRGFWVSAEDMLIRNPLYHDMPYSMNSPTLGVPPALLRIVIELKHLDSQIPGWKANFKRLQDEVKHWEAFVQNDEEIEEVAEDKESRRIQCYYRDTSYLYILIISVLLQLQLSVECAHRGSPDPAPKDSWQLAKAIDVLRKYEHDEGWVGSYISSWPVYSIGYFVSTPEDVSLVASDMERRWETTKMMQVARYKYDLGSTWAKRGFPALPNTKNSSSPRYGTLSMLNDAPPKACTKGK